MTDSIPSLPAYDDVDDWFLSLEADATPAELHGQLCGLIAGNGKPQPNQWLAISAELLEVTIQPGTPIAEGMCALIDIAEQQMQAEGFELELLIPDEEVPVAEQAEGLAQWTQGFLTGFALAGNTQQGWQQLSEETREVLTDLASIAQMAFEEVEDSDEKDYMELREYVRLSSIQIWLELNPPPPREVDPDSGTPYPPAANNCINE